MPRTLHDPPGILPVPTTIDEAKAAHLTATGEALTPGTLLLAPLATKRGPLAGEAGSLVVTVVKDFWDSPTIKALRAAVGTALGLSLLAVSGQVMAASGDLAAVNWQTTQKIAIAAGAFSLASAYAAWWKRRDNDPVKQG